jgi:hypothetical protein
MSRRLIKKHEIHGNLLRGLHTLSVERGMRVTTLINSILRKEVLEKNNAVNVHQYGRNSTQVIHIYGKQGEVK